MVTEDRARFAQVDLHAKIPGSQLLVIPGAGHGLHEQDPDALAAAMINFFA